jgi:hypothetical protein
MKKCHLQRGKPLLKAVVSVMVIGYHRPPLIAGVSAFSFRLYWGAFSKETANEN